MFERERTERMLIMMFKTVSAEDINFMRKFLEGFKTLLLYLLSYRVNYS